MTELSGQVPEEVAGDQEEIERRTLKKLFHGEIKHYVEN